MKKLTLTLGIVIGVLLMLLALSSFGQINKNKMSMKSSCAGTLMQQAIPFDN